MPVVQSDRHTFFPRTSHAPYEQPMITSRYTFAFTTPGGRHYLINYLSGSLDELQAEEFADMDRRIADNRWDDLQSAPYLIERGYLFQDQTAEESTIQERFLEFQEEYDRTPTQLIFSTTYACNFSCTYCFQDSYREDSKILTPEITDAFFRYINRKFASEPVRPYITLFGGEPLLGANRYRTHLLYFLEEARRHNYAICVVTNGYELESYLPDFKRIGVEIREIQVSLDGSPEMQNLRRPTAGGGPTFERVAAGIDATLRAGMRVNLRMIVDRDNIASLVDLARYAREKGWMDYPESQFETTIGRNYELHTCQPKAHLFDRVALWEEFAALASEHPLLAEFHRPQFHGMRYLKETGGLPMPIFDGCPAGKKEWAFDVNGDIYGCTASVGVEKYRLGTIFEEASREEEDRRLEWATRDILSIPECSHCSASLSCGGGCGVLAANKSGKVHSPDCRPVRELVAIGADYYRVGSE